MTLPVFKLEEYLSAREFTAPYMFCSSDIETFAMSDIVKLADENTKLLWNTLRLGYTQTQGMPELREVIADLYEKQIAENILCFSGAEEGIYCMFHALLQKQDHVIVITPCYESLASIPKSICDVTAVELKFEQSWELDLEQIRAAIKPNTKLIVVNYPHNPTGALLTKAQQAQLVDIARAHDLWIFSDEVYRGVELDQNLTLPAFASLYEKAMSLGVMSKAYGMAGLRIGWIACSDTKILHKMDQHKNYLSICNSAPSEVLALIALKNSDVILQRNRELLTKNFALLERFMEQHSDILSWVKPKGGCTAYLKLNENIDSYKFAETMLERTGLLVLPASIYGQNAPCFRISFGRANMPEMLGIFEQYIQQFRDEHTKAA